MRPYVTLRSSTERKNQHGLLLEDVPLKNILQQSQTPLYATSLTAIEKRVQKYQQTLKKHFVHSQIYYACKANFSFPILNAIQKQGIGLDIVSIGEWVAGRRAGFSPEKICFAGVGKREAEWQTAIMEGIGALNIEHLQELSDILDFISQQRYQLPRVPVLSLRLNPCLEIETHPHLKTGALDSKFGILFEDFQQWLLEKRKLLKSEDFTAWVKPLSGIHVHIGSQLMAKDIFVHTVQSVLNCAQFMLDNDLSVHHLDLGGGLGVPYEGVPENAEDISLHVDFLCETLKLQAKFYPKLMECWGSQFENLFVCLEPGRSIVASSTLFFTTVLYTKVNRGTEKSVSFCYVDGAMNDFPRPSLYGARHHVELVDFHNVTKHNFAEQKVWNVVGPVCESGDFLAKDALLSEPSRKDILAFFEAGAYCRSMASEYNLRPLPNEVFIQGNCIYDREGVLLGKASE